MKQGNELAIAVQVRQMQTRKRTPREVVDEALSRIKDRESEIGAFAHLDAEAVRRRADECPIDRSLPLAGIPVGVKDNIDGVDGPTTCGSSIYRARMAPIDAPIVSALQRLGAIPFGKTVCTEFATFTAGKTRNPHQLEHTPGGSSSGSAAAVAAGFLPLALGTQTAGSIVRPASYCGVVGFKPSRGRYSPGGVKLLAHSFDTVGWFTRTVSDARYVQSALRGELEDGRLASRLPVIGLCRTPWWSQGDMALMDQAFKFLTRGLKAFGIGHRWLDAPPEHAALVEHHGTVMRYEVAQSLGAEYGQFREELSPSLRALIEEGQAVRASAYMQACEAIDRESAMLSSWMHGLDAVVVPAVPSPAPRLELGTGDPVFCRPWSALGGPAVAFPVLTMPSGLPFGLQAVAPRYDDERLLWAAQWLERAVSNSASQPTTPIHP
ncbi:amidase [Hydrogenophaga sp. BPS33]|uniref:amidase n=1 Tax=Hydrogenophaga sp. BPS33 TaxID=2651974 RepID=UPI00131FCEC6|nr:amidase [Hydrogenophaga sp. BPS33]QHE84706.1 amidase [Hydrogenophaga sp. BPS33]